MNPLIEKAVSAIWLEDISSSEEGSIPEVLKAHLFDGSDRTYAVFDTGTVNEGIALVEEEAGYQGTLLQGDEAQDLVDVMPCLLELAPEDSLTRKLFLEVPGAHAALGTLHLWQTNPVLFIRCASPPEVLRKHLRRFLKPADTKGLRRYVRLWNPVIAYDYLRDLEAPTPLLGLYLSGGSDPLTVIARKGSSAVVAKAKSSSGVKDRPILSDVDIRALTFRIKSDFHDRLVSRVMERGAAKGTRFERARVAHISKQVMAEMEVHKRGDVPKMQDHEKLVLILLMMHDDAIPMVLWGPVMRNQLLPWAQRVNIVGKSYLTGLRRMNGLEVV